MVFSDHRRVSSLALARGAIIRLAAQRPSISAECSIALVVPFLLAGSPVDSLDDGCRWRGARECAYMSELRIAREAATGRIYFGHARRAWGGLLVKSGPGSDHDAMQ